MPLRRLRELEIDISRAVISLGAVKDWEFAAYLETPNGRLIEIRTLMRDDGADPSRDVHAKATEGAPIVVHHNHLSQESLSFPDWRGLATMLNETFAHCVDGTVYWGRVLNRGCVQKIICCSAQTIEMNAENHLVCILLHQHHEHAAELGHYFRKEVVNRAMKIRGFVEYEYQWGTGGAPPYVRRGAPKPPGSAGVWGARVNDAIDLAASLLAPSL